MGTAQQTDAPQPGRGRPPRLPGYDYSQAGAYFLTICVQDRLALIGSLQEETVRLTPAGEMIEQVWSEIPSSYPGVGIDQFIVMPDHIHGIVLLHDDKDRTLALPDVVSRFKTLTQHKYRHGVRTADWTPYAGRLWQQNYYEHIIRNGADLQKIRRYILENPLRWHLRRQGLL